MTTQATNGSGNQRTSQDDVEDDDDSITIVDERFLGKKALAVPNADKTKRDADDSDDLQSLHTTGEECFSPRDSTVTSPPHVGKDASLHIQSSPYSPATQTLNTLSQNIGDLREATEDCEAIVESRTAEAPWKSPVREIPPAQRTKDDSPVSIPRLRWNQDTQRKYEWIPIQINVPPNRRLGMTLHRIPFDDSLPHSRLLSLEKSGKLCYIQELKSGEAAERKGLQLGDLVCHPQRQDSDTGTSHPVLATLEEVEEWAKCMPFRFSVLRRRTPLSKDPCPTTTPLVTTHAESPTLGPVDPAVAQRKVCQQDTYTTSRQALINDGSEHTQDNNSLSTLQKGRTTLHDSKLPGVPSTVDKACPVPAATLDPPMTSLPGVSKADPPSHDGIPPFCRLCNYLCKHRKDPVSGKTTDKPRAHHAWCPQNPFFADNGSQELLTRIQYGRRQLHCPACETEYQTGRIQPMDYHSAVCRENQQRLLLQGEEEIHRPSKEVPADRRRTKTTKYKEKTKEKRMHEKRYKPTHLNRPRDSMQSSQQDEGDTNRPTKRKKKLSNRDDPRMNPVGATVASGRSTSNKVMKTTSHKASFALTPKIISTKSTPPESPRRVSPHTTEHGSAPRQMPSGRELGIVSNQQPVKKKLGTFKPIWQSTTENPWGGSGFQDGDVLLYGPQKGISHVEMVLPSPRYCLCPFRDSSSYRTTHHHPDILVLSLKRDPSAQIPWGFNVSRDEFGHACLVTSVQPMSPATQAAVLGSPRTIGLNVHDMILMINGRPVGGMTEAALEIELEVSGYILHLVVSQYKHALSSYSQRATIEMGMTSRIDEVLRDDRIIGWREIGHGEWQEPLPTVRPQQVGANGRNEPSITPATVDVSPSLETERPDCVLSPAISAIGRQDRQEIPVQTTMDYQVSLPEVSLYRISNGLKSAHESGSIYVQSDELKERTLSNTDQDQIQTPAIERQHFRDADLTSSEDETGCGDSRSTEGRSDDESQQWEDDNNAWNGCVCGKIHRGIGLFWIQCDACNSWYDVAERCVGFSEKEAKTRQKWTCWACDEGVDSPILLHTTPVLPTCRSRDQQHPSQRPLSGEAMFSMSQEIGSRERAESSDSFTEIPPEDSCLRLESICSTPDSSRNHFSSREETDKPRGDKESSTKATTPAMRRSGRKRNMKAKARAVKVARNGESIASKTSCSAFKTDTPDQSSQRRPKPHCVMEEFKGDGDVNVSFKVNDMVEVIPHSWPTVNNLGGIGKVLKTYFDEDGKRVYDVRYTVSRHKEKTIYAEWVKACFLV